MYSISKRRVSKINVEFKPKKTIQNKRIPKIKYSKYKQSVNDLIYFIFKVPKKRRLKSQKE
jgi:hypothetical protein